MRGGRLQMWLALLGIVIGLWGLPIFAQLEGVRTLEQMRRDLIKIDRSIQESKEKIKKVKDAEFLPELYFALAEFLVQRSRYMYAIKVAENPKKSITELDFTGEKRPKLEAIQTYDTIIEKFPRLESRDKAIFFKAHELRELGRRDDMLKTYLQLTKEYPNSAYWIETQIILGDYFFEDKKNMDLALEVYRRVLNRPPGPFTPLANYKMGWVLVNQTKFKEALESYVRVLTQNRNVDLSQLPEIYRKTDIRREALLALVWPYSELPARTGLLAYFQGLAPDKVSYEKVLARLGRRLMLKHRFVDATKVFLEYLRLAGDLRERLEASERLYVSMKNTQTDWPVRGLVQEVARTLNQMENSSDLKPQEITKALHDLELFARDVATRQNKRAKKTRNKEDWDWVIRDYDLYLALFPKSKSYRAIKLNLAESYFNAGRPVEAGHEYEWLALNTKEGAQAKSYFDSAIQSYIAAIRQQSALSRLALTEARYGLREVGRAFIAKYPADPTNDDILFSIGQTYYDERRFEKAVSQLKLYIEKYPRGQRVAVASNLILDAHNQREDFKAIVADGRALLGNAQIKDARLKAQVRDIVQQAELKAVQVAAGDFSAPDYAANLLKLANKHKGSSLGDQALYEAFIAFRAKKDIRAYDSGEQLLLQHRSSKYALEVTAAMGQMALSTADFRRAALYFEIFHDRYPNRPEAKEFLKNAARMRELMGEFKLAAADYKKLGDGLAQARMDFFSGDWSALLRSAPAAGGLAGSYYEGLAHYRLRGIGPAQKALERTVQLGGNNFEEQEMAAHALYLLAMGAMDNYKAVRMRPGGETKAVNDKAARLKALETQLTKVVQLGQGRWTIAALYGLGQAHAEFAKFIRESPRPSGLNPTQTIEYQRILSQQADQYSKTAASYFQQCASHAEKFEVLTRYVMGCLSGGRIAVDEAQETLTFVRASEQVPQEAAPIRRSLFDRPQDVGLLSELARVYVKAKDYSMAELVLNHALEFEPGNAALMANLGSINLYKRDDVMAKVWFDKAKAKQSRQPLALWGLAGLFKKFHFPTKRQQALAAAQSAGRPVGIVHPLLNLKVSE